MSPADGRPKVAPTEKGDKAQVMHAQRGKTSWSDLPEKSKSITFLFSGGEALQPNPTKTYHPNPTYAVAPKGACGNPNPAHSETTKLMQPRPQRSGADRDWLVNSPTLEQATRRGDHRKSSLCRSSLLEMLSSPREKADPRVPTQAKPRPRPRRGQKQTVHTQPATPSMIHPNKITHPTKHNVTPHECSLPPLHHDPQRPPHQRHLSLPDPVHDPPPGPLAAAELPHAPAGRSHLLYHHRDHHLRHRLSKSPQAHRNR